LAEWGLSDLDDTVTLLVTELVSNGIRHAETKQLTLEFSFDEVCLRISVSDGDPSPPVARVRQKLTVGGWGLALVDSLSNKWGTDIDGDRGKTVWFEIDARKVKR